MPSQNGGTSVGENVSRATQGRIAALSTSAIPMLTLRQENRNVIRSIIEAGVGQKTILFDSSLVGPFNVLVEASDLKQWGVEAWYELKEDHLASGVLEALEDASPKPLSRSSLRPKLRPSYSKTAAQDLTATTGGEPDATLIFFVRPSASQARCVANYIRHIEESRGCQDLVYRYIIAFVPRPTEEIMTELAHYLGPEHEQLFSSGRILMHPCSVYFFPFDSDLMSLELYGVLRDFHSFSDPSGLIFCSEALSHLQTVLKGLFPRLWVVGSAGKFVCDQLLRIRRELQMQLPVPDALRQIAQPSVSSVPLSAKGTTASGTQGAAKTSVDSSFVPPLYIHAPITNFEGASIFGTGGSALEGKSSSDTSDFELNENLACTAPIPSQLKNGPYNRIYDAVEDVILFDRRVDLVTPFCTPFTYEALLDQIIGLNQTVVSTANLQKATAPKTQSQTESRPFVSYENSNTESKSGGKTVLTSADTIFGEIRHLPQSQVGVLLHSKASDVQKTYKEKESLTSIAEINAFMKRFKIKQIEHVSISLHVNFLTIISNALKTDAFRSCLKLEDDVMSSPTASASAVADIISALEDLIDDEPTPHQAYRLLCLLSSVNNGLKPKWLDSIRRSLCQTFGVQELLRLRYMEKAGLLTVQTSAMVKNTWNDVKTALNLIVDDVGANGNSALRRLEDIAYVCSGYAPLSVRLIEQLYWRPGGWKSLSRVFDLLWGPTLEARQIVLGHQQQDNGGSGDAEVPDTENQKHQGDKNTGGATQRAPVTVVFFLGGCTYAEIAALRYLTQKHKRQFLILTTEVLNCKKLIDSFEPQLKE